MTKDMVGSSLLRISLWWSSSSFLSSNLAAQHCNDSGLLTVCEFVHHISPVPSISRSGPTAAARTVICCCCHPSFPMSSWTCMCSTRRRGGTHWRYLLLLRMKNKDILIMWSVMVREVFSRAGETACSSAWVQVDGGAAPCETQE